MRVGTLLGIAVGLTACAESTSPVAPLRVMDQPPSLAAVVSSTETTLPLKRTLWISCANDGLGEDVTIEGEVIIRTHSTDDGNGGVHLSMHVRPSGVVGVGEVSGLKYRGTGGTFEGEHYAADGFPALYSFVNNFRIIGQGPRNNLGMHMTVHQTMNANGELTADVDLSHSDCK
jgi:hypothetical protein